MSIPTLVPHVVKLLRAARDAELVFLIRGRFHMPAVTGLGLSCSFTPLSHNYRPFPCRAWALHSRGMGPVGGGGG